MTKQEKAVYNKAYREAHPEKFRTYREANPEKHKAYSKTFRNAHPGKNKASCKAWRSAHPEKVRAWNKAYNKASCKAWRNAHPEEVRAHLGAKDSRQRGYGYNPLNIYFPGSVGHHIDDMDVVFIPEEIHTACSVSHDTEKHRKLVMSYYGSIENMINGERLK